MDIASTLAFQIRRIQDLAELQTHLQQQGGQLQQDYDILGRQLGLIELSRSFYLKAVDLVYERSIGEIEKVLNAALEFVFYDKLYHVRLELDERFSKSLEIVLLDKSKDPPLPLAIEDGIGNGVRTIISFVLHSYYLLNRKCCPALFIDEHYSYLSEEYVDRFFTFVKGLCRSKGLMLVLISHDQRFIVYADKVYRISDGRIQDMTPKSVTAVVSS